jgi:hypothetical protein
MSTSGEAVGRSQQALVVRKDEPMAKTNRAFGKAVSSFVSRHHLTFVVVLSLLHVGLALLPPRDSGRADSGSTAEGLTVA